MEAQLNDFDPAVRAAALAELISLAPPCAPEAPVANMHCHTLFSFNAYGHSPTSLAWLARRRGFRALGIVDFDVLDGVDEFLGACEAAGVRGSAGIETRVYVPEYATRELSSPGEPGITYHMGIGFTSGRAPAAVAPILAAMRARAGRRNRDMAARVNAHLSPVAIDYDRDVVPLTPGGNPTERHLLVAYLRAAAALPDPAGFWAQKLGVPLEQIQGLMGDIPALQNLIRARLMKRGGVGYVQPSPAAFPTVADFHRLIEACGALPCVAWLDGTASGEEPAVELLDFWLGQGALALNIIPDRNWNIADPVARRLKVGKLHEIVRLAQERDLPLNVGTEMNAFGQKLVDDLAAPELAPLRDAFLDGASLIYGHTALGRACGLGYQSEWARAHLPARRERNAFYTRVGQLLPPGRPGLDWLADLPPGISPADLLARLG